LCYLLLKKTNLYIALIIVDYVLLYVCRFESLKLDSKRLDISKFIDAQ